MHSPVATFQSRTVWSQPPDKAKRPSGDKDTARISLVCPSRVRRHSPVSRSHKRRTRAAPPVSR